jgi:enoyl-[acyl-carrier protein] reductase I
MTQNSGLMKGKRGVILGVHHVDSGYHVVGMKRPEVPDISLAKD